MGNGISRMMNKVCDEVQCRMRLLFTLQPIMILVIIEVKQCLVSFSFFINVIFVPVKCLKNFYLT